MIFLIYTAILFVFSYLTCDYLIPKIRTLMISKKIAAQPDHRSSHDVPTPNLGGIAFYVVLMISFYLIASAKFFGIDNANPVYEASNLIVALIPGLTILFIVGLKDDIIALAPISKLLAQIISAALFVFHYSKSINNLYGFMGIEDINPILAGAIAVFILVAVINALNLIDGIDGLAATVSIIMFSTFGFAFFTISHTFLFSICLVMVGVLLAYLRYNLSSTQKIFMGDTGSMVLGFMLGVMAISFLSLDPTDLAKMPIRAENLPIVTGAILIIPFFDTVRVFIVRISKKKNPFKPDRSHIHHIIIDKFSISHRRASFVLGVSNFLVIILISLLAVSSNNWILLTLFICLLLLFTLFFFLINKTGWFVKIKRRNSKQQKMNARSSKISS
ncbi:undecaprenyl/decaprenyl-phosphate alpha-N-acetylglucosaminyl 1-phosphate transferase [Brumimicrobium aurantiacum]|uniref:Undecaprenyl/decaprenyl-phosphate alpha-N-acetylglucosaminyl 1-phosphate transferase n=2 Tax=Brumimicrobium aurantiacum TaxID=1737063 RepID=A0A3E1F0I9_9FLAO|nr:undecaprenyl/decaprenyl-phosphate alpha-N-acetylglucosaminyl 1-phosphate transferase [Brumimicrobium aurantiacum]